MNTLCISAELNRCTSVYTKAVDNKGFCGSHLRPRIVAVEHGPLKLAPISIGTVGCAQTTITGYGNTRRQLRHTLALHFILVGDASSLRLGSAFIVLRKRGACGTCGVLYHPGT
eukprot:1181857-Prorocentrum_minimum.AAC.5